MKQFIFIFIVLLVRNHVFSQQCPVIADFSTACTNTINVDGCETWVDGCGSGWTRSHGTPQMIPYSYDDGGTTINSFFALMWSANVGSRGEGMFYTTSNPFLVNHPYNGTIRLQTSGGDGVVYVYATNGLTQSTLDRCGDAVPIISDTKKQLIGGYSGVSNLWIDVPLSFVANANYTQLWIYPQSFTDVQYDAYVLDIYTCTSCSTNTLIYNTGIVPSGLTEGGSIWVGSSAGLGGSGTVTIDPDQTTTLMAGLEINLLPEFNASVTSGTFLAKIGCDNAAGARKKIHDPKGPLYKPNDEAHMIAESNQVKGISIYPSVSNGMITIAGNMNTLNNSVVMVTDEAGRLVFSTKNNMNTDNIKLNLSRLKNGVYFVQIKNATNQVVKKIIINR